MKKGLEGISDFGSRTSEPIPMNVWAAFEKRSQEWMTLQEMDWWHRVCDYQVQHHSDPKMRELFQRLGQLKKMRRAVAEAASAFAISPK
ncbi:MAG: hypothetical protein ACR2MX_05580 [Cyclobacteriaceae bacterium]